MPSDFAVESMEILLIAVGAVIGLSAIVFPIVWAIAFLMFREQAAHAPAVPRVVSVPAPAAAKEHDAGFPAAIAG